MGGEGHVAVDGYLIGLIGEWMLYNRIQKGKVRHAVVLQILSLL